MIRRILVPLDLSPHSAAATERGIELASHFGASVTGLTVLDTEGIRDAAALPFHAEFLDYPPAPAVKMAKDAAEKLGEARSQFEARCHERQIACDLRRLRGTPATAILDLARFHDLLVMGLRSHFHFETEDEPGDTLHRVLDLTPVPTLLVRSYEEQLPSRVLIAYDGSQEATRALHGFAALYPAYRPEVRLVTATSDKNAGGHLLDEAQKYLQVCGVEHITTELVAGSAIDEAVEERGLDWADLIVAGVRSKPRLKKLFVGSFVEYLIEQGHQPLLLSS